MCEMHEENHPQLINGHKLLGVKRSGQNQPFLELEHPISPPQSLGKRSNPSDP